MTRHSSALKLHPRPRHSSGRAFASTTPSSPESRGRRGSSIRAPGRVKVVATATIMIASILLATSAADATPPGENGRIAFRQFFNERRTWGAIFTSEADGTDITQVTHPRRGVLTDTPDWSPNGRWLTFRRDIRGDHGSHIFKIRPDGTDRVDLTKLTEHRGPDWAEDRGAAWSPDGKRIAFVRGFARSRGGPNVFVMWIDGTHLHQVTRPVGRYEDYGPQWSPDGTHLAFKRLTESECGCRTADHAALFTVRVDGPHLRRLTPWKLDGGDEPDYSPNGRWILFISYQCLCRSNNLWVVHPNGSALHRITSDPGHRFLWLSSSFSPDGTMIVTARRPTDGLADVYVMHADGTGLTNITASPQYDSNPDWGPRA